MTDIAETLDLDATQIEDETVLENTDEAPVAPARPRLPAYVSNS